MQNAFHNPRRLACVISADYPQFSLLPHVLTSSQSISLFQMSILHTARLFASASAAYTSVITYSISTSQTWALRSTINNQTHHPISFASSILIQTEIPPTPSSSPLPLLPPTVRKRSNIEGAALVHFEHICFHAWTDFFIPRYRKCN